MIMHYSNEKINNKLLCVSISANYSWKKNLQLFVFHAISLDLTHGGLMAKLMAVEMHIFTITDHDYLLL